MKKEWVVIEICGVEYFETKKKAIDYANELMKEYVDDGEWCEGVENITIAKITHNCVKKNIIHCEYCLPENRIDGDCAIGCKFELEMRELEKENLRIKRES